MENIAYISLAVLGVAFLYSSVGHGGASGYLAVLAVCGATASVMKPTALALNIFVSLIAFIQFARQGHFRWELTWPFLVASVPAAFLAGKYIGLSDDLYKKLLALVLLFPVLRLLGLLGRMDTGVRGKVSLAGALAAGLLIGLLSGMMGIGGGIILSPLILLLGWGGLKETAATSALFIFANSVSGFAGLLTEKGFSPDSNMMVLAAAGVLGGIAGSYYGSGRFNIPVLKRILALVLMVACFKLIIT
ncbi:MAG: sulfite exporter TauE/SafE family protein [Bacteroidota bacterium]